MKISKNILFLCLLGLLMVNNGIGTNESTPNFAENETNTVTVLNDTELSQNDLINGEQITAPSSAFKIEDINYSPNSPNLMFLNDSMLTAYFAGNESSQNGTASYPYIFNNYVFGGNASATALTIANCSAHLVINNSVFFDLGIGIKIMNSANITVINCTFHSLTTTGISCTNTTKITMHWNIFEESYCGINSTENNTFWNVRYNNFTYSESGMFLTNLNNTEIFVNRFSNITGTGICITNVSNTLIGNYQFSPVIGIEFRGIIGVNVAIVNAYFRNTIYKDVLENQIAGNITGNKISYGPVSITSSSKTHFIYNNTIADFYPSTSYPIYPDDFNVTLSQQDNCDYSKNFTFWDNEHPDKIYQIPPLYAQLNSTIDMLDFILPLVTKPTSFSINIWLKDYLNYTISKTFTIYIENDAPTISVNSSVMHHKLTPPNSPINKSFSIQVQDMMNTTSIPGTIQIMETVNGTMIHNQTHLFNMSTPSPLVVRPLNGPEGTYIKSLDYGTNEGKKYPSNQITNFTYTPDATIAGTHEITIIATDGYNATSTLTIYALIEDWPALYPEEIDSSIDLSFDLRYLFGGMAGILVGIVVMLFLKKTK